ncbi:UNKNOWN [Stylonychia lemnae]|uniref:Uncharacterized protein n=1 Tax=Stylonychia lemnae TaxID=5949 RepID=A0A078AHH2_STYLE|nr:UNKNOWN [Stylonychia lemnae]|eukprot:CDW81699.1 UNKNOWN [Stylonychia lemnae]
MKSTLGRAITLRKLDNQFSPSASMLNTQSVEFTNLKPKFLMPQTDKLVKQEPHQLGYNSPSSQLNRSLKDNIGDVFFNNKEVKNIRFLPFLRERNGLGKIIESDQEIPLKQKKVPSIMETNRILAQKKKQSEEASIKLNTNVPINGIPLGADSSFQAIPTMIADLSPTEQQLLQSQAYGIKRISVNSSLNQHPNQDIFNSSKFLDNQEDLEIFSNNVLRQNPSLLKSTFTPMESIRDKEYHHSSLSNQNHQIPYVNFKIQKDKNFVFLNQIYNNQVKPTLEQKNQQSQKKIKLRDNCNIISSNLPSLGTYDPKPEVIEFRQGMGFSFENSSLVNLKNQSLKRSMSQANNILFKRQTNDVDNNKDSYNYLLRLLQPQNEITALMAKTKDQKEMEQTKQIQLDNHSNPHYQKSGNNNNSNNNNQQKNQQSEKKQNNQQNSNSNQQSNQQQQQGVFETRLPEIPLESVYENRSKIKSMIMDIKTNIYKMDKY